MTTACKTLVGISLSRLESIARPPRSSTSLSLPFSSPRPFFSSLLLSLEPGTVGLRIEAYRAGAAADTWRRRFHSSCINGGAVELGTSDSTGGTTPVRQNVILEIPEDSVTDTVEELLSKSKHHDDDVARFMKMERKLDVDVMQGGGRTERWFPYLDKFKAGDGVYLSSAQVLEALDPYIMVSRKERFRNVVKNRSYSVCLVVEGLSDFGNVSAAFRSADALGFQSVHVVSCDSSKRCNKA